ncbi:hypothetical protein EMPG_11380 [Blastomyces silverae]|uniref:Uncharacterized protein n=1 Tax=Blastomyces silverae TaxID=2060906 RepID=A0A0H1BQ68_9EURO|nr:hypothetical protein EMPG_11380 [Blastomyces silverae]
MNSAFHASFRPWVPPHPKPPPSHKPLYSSTASRSPPPSPHHDPPRSTLPLPKHHLPARPPAEVCVPSSIDTRPGSLSALKLQPQPRQISLPPSSTPAPESLKQGGSPPHDSAHTSSNSLPLSTYDPQDPAPLPVALPLLEGETTEANPSSPSATIPDGSLEEFPRLPDLLKNIPIDPAIIVDDESWETNSIHWPVRQGNNSLVGPKPICSYPMFQDAPNYPQVSKERLCIWATLSRERRQFRER